MEGNSIYSEAGLTAGFIDDCDMNATYQSLVFSEQDGNTGVDFADGERDEHGAGCRVCGGLIAEDVKSRSSKVAAGGRDDRRPAKREINARAINFTSSASLSHGRRTNLLISSIAVTLGSLLLCLAAFVTALG